MRNLLFTAALAWLAPQVEAAPAILFADIQSGPADAPITIYGTGFGAQRVTGEVRSRLTIGGQEIGDYLVWSAHNATNAELDRIVVTAGPRISSGDIVVTVDGVDSNPVPFTLRPGRLFYLSPAGSDSNDCALAQPCATIAHAVRNRMQPGDFLLLRGGLYTEGALTLNAADSGTAALPKSIVAFPGESVFFSEGPYEWRIDASYITLSGIRLFQGRSLAIGPATSGVRIVNNAIASGITASGDSLVLAGNVCPGAARGPASCFAVNGGVGALLAKNLAIGSSLSAFTIAGGARNTVLDGNAAIGSDRSGFEIGPSDGVLIRNAVSSGNNHAGVWIGDGARSVRVRFNTFVENGLSGVVVDGAAASAQLRNNLFYQTRTGCQTNCDAAPLSHVYVAERNAGAVAIERNFYQTSQPVIYGATDANAVSGDIFFQNFANANVRLYTGSAALDAALAVEGEGDERDADGQARPFGTAPDIGAYEFNGQVLAAPIPSPTPGPTPPVTPVPPTPPADPAPEPNPTPQPPTPTPDPTPGSGLAGDPIIYFTDLESGPNSGGENNAGAVITLYGKNFGATRGTSAVTIGGGEAAAYKAWGTAHLWYEKISIQLGPNARTGNIQVTVNGHTSNGVPFVVRPGNIYFLGPSGSDGADGSFSAPWRNAPTARNRMKPGDIVYLLNGFEQTNDDGEGWNTPLLFRTGGAADAPLTWAAYPGATATLGSTSGPAFGMRMADRSPVGYLVFSGIGFRGSQAGALSSGIAPGSPGMRFIANDFEGRDASCFVSQFATGIAFHGNTAHDCGAGSKTKELEHGVYFSTDSNGIDMGWNLVANIPSCRGIQVHSSPLEGTRNGFNQFQIRIHHNFVRDTFCDGMVIATVDPSKGPVEIFNNVFLRTGYGTPINNHGFFSCFYSPGTTNTGTPGSGNIEFYNNTLVQCGNARAGDGWTAAVVNGNQNPRLGLRARNNIIVASAGVPYSPYGPQTGSNNMYSGGTGTPPAGLGTLADPRFVSATDFHLAAGSPAIDTGLATGIGFDFDGAPRPAGAAMDLGAYEHRP